MFCSYGYHIICSGLLWHMKVCRIDAPRPGSDMFLNEVWRLNEISTDVVITPLPALYAFIQNFNLPNDYFDDYQSGEDFFTNAVTETPFLHYLRPTLVPLIKYSACRCTPNDTVAQGQLDPISVLSIPFPDVQGTLQDTVQHFFDDERIADNSCSVCKRSRTCVKRVRFEVATIGFVVHLQRNLGTTDHRGLPDHRKVTTPVDMGDDVVVKLVAGQATYRLTREEHTYLHRFEGPCYFY